MNHTDRQEVPLPELAANAPSGGHIASFFGGVMAASVADRKLAYEVGHALGQHGFTLYHGGYNGLMEYAARGAADAGARVVAVTLSGKEEWGDFNPYVKNSIYARSMGARLTHLVDHANVIVAMAGGVGSLHELTAALWYSGNVRRTPVLVLGQGAQLLVKFLKEKRWLYESPTRPLDFLHTPTSMSQVHELLSGLAGDWSTSRRTGTDDLVERVRRTACVDGSYQLANGEVLRRYFDPFRLASDPRLATELAEALAEKVRNVPDVVVGIALGGVALATDLSRLLERPLMLVRPQAKTYGTFAQVEGCAAHGRRALIVDDVVRSGKQMLAAVRLLHNAKLSVAETLCVVERSGQGRMLLSQQGIELQALWRDTDTAHPMSLGCQSNMESNEC